MSSPGENVRHPFESPENKDSRPLYHSTDNFVPLGFSTPQHRNADSKMFQRNYYSAQPKYMLPRQRGGFRQQQQQQQQHGRYHHQFQQDQRNYGGNNSSGDADERAGCSGPPDRRNFNQRNWGRPNFRNNQGGQFHKRGRFGFGHQQNKDSGGYNINDYFHPSMLEDPWAQLVQKIEQSKPNQGDSSDAAEDGGGGGNSSGNGED